MTATLIFCGGAGTVTGANFLLETRSTGSGQTGTRILVDCGTLESENSAGGCDTANLAPFPYDPATIDALLVTHAHADHIGRIPRLVRQGFKGSIYSTHATKDLAALMFDDALCVMREHVERSGCEPLYDERDVAGTLALWAGKGYHEPFEIGDGVTAELLDAGHILGSSLVRLTRGGRTILFSGDLGNVPEPLLCDTESPEGAHYIVMESVYGDRMHEDQANRREILRGAIEQVRAERGTLLIPSFSLERTQVLLYELNELVETKRMEPIPVYLDAPLAIRATEIFRKYPELFNERARAHFARGDDPFSFPGLSVTLHTGESRAIHKEPGPKVIIAGAGMSGGGRVRAHEREYLGDKHAALLFVGFQAPGTLGRRIQDGARSVVIDGEHVHVKAQIAALTGYSGHADRDQLMHFIERAGDSVERVFITMGEPRASMYLAQRLKDFFGVETLVPAQGETADLAF